MKTEQDSNNGDKLKNKKKIIRKKTKIKKKTLKKNAKIEKNIETENKIEENKKNNKIMINEPTKKKIKNNELKEEDNISEEEANAIFREVFIKWFTGCFSSLNSYKIRKNQQLNLKEFCKRFLRSKKKFFEGFVKSLKSKNYLNKLIDMKSNSYNKDFASLYDIIVNTKF